MATFHRRSPYWIAAGILLSAAGLSLAEPPASPALSTVVPAADLRVAATNYLTKIAGFMTDEATFAKNQEQLAQKANALVALAQSIGLHDGDAKLKAVASDVMTAGRELSRAKDFATAKTAHDKLTGVIGQTSGGAAPKWEKFASLGKLMHESAEVNSRLRRNVRRFARTKDDSAEAAAILAVFAQATLYDTHEVKNPADLPKWYAMAIEMRDAAAELSKSAHAGDEATFKKALDRMGKSCDDCHEVFHAE
ncbi:MAG: cytochrome c [Pirellulales bacterium]